MKHGTYIHAVSGTLVEVVETLGGDNTGRIKYTSPLLGCGGFLAYNLEQRDAWTMVVKEMNADPPGIGLGTLLMWHAANTAAFRAAASMDADAVAQPAQDFYGKLGFTPDLDEMQLRIEDVRDRKAKGDLTYDQEQQVWASAAATWHAKTQLVLDRSYAKISAVWTVLRDVPLD